MAVRYPLVVDTTDNNKIKELPSGDSLNLSGNDIVNVVNVTASGTLTVQNLAVESTTFTIDGNSLNSVAFSGSYLDLTNTPTLFDGAYSSLSGKPSIPGSIEDLANVGSTAPTNGQVLVYNTTLGRYEPGNINADFDNQFSLQDIDDLSNVVFIGDKTNDVLKFDNGVWKNLRVDYSELTGTTNVVEQGDTLTGSLVGDVKGSVFGDDSSVLVDSVNNNINGTIKSDNWSLSSDSYLTISNGGATGPGPIQIVASAQLDLRVGSGYKVIAHGNVEVENGLTVATGITGDLTGSVFADDSSLLVDAVSGTIPGYVSLATLKTEVAASADFADFQTRIAAL
jgi:hypothetical protein